MNPPPLPPDPDDDPQPVAWSRICPVVAVEVSALWWRLSREGIRLPHHEIVIRGGRP